MAIKIMTRLHDGVCRSSDDQVRTAYELKTGPRNLVKAIALLDEHSESMSRSYGNVGHSGSWIEIDGIAVRYDDLAEINRDDAALYKELGRLSKPESRTQKAADFIAALPNYEQRLREDARYERELRQIEEAKYRRELEQLEAAEMRRKGQA